MERTVMRKKRKTTTKKQKNETKIKRLSFDRRRGPVPRTPKSEFCPQVLRPLPQRLLLRREVLLEGLDRDPPVAIARPSPAVQREVDFTIGAAAEGLFDRVALHVPDVSVSLVRLWL